LGGNSAVGGSGGAGTFLTGIALSASVVGRSFEAGLAGYFMLFMTSEYYTLAI
jgi:hypothetical protein